MRLYYAVKVKNIDYIQIGLITANNGSSFYFGVNNLKRVLSFKVCYNSGCSFFQSKSFCEQLSP